LSRWYGGKLDDDYRPLGAMLAYAGLRVSEALAVRWRDLDLDAGRLTVAAQLDRAGQTVPLKTTASGATVDLLPALVGELRAHRARRGALGIHLVRADAPPGPGSLIINEARYAPSRRPPSTPRSGTSPRATSGTRSSRTRSTPGSRSPRLRGSRGTPHPP